MTSHYYSKMARTTRHTRNGLCRSTGEENQEQDRENEHHCLNQNPTF